MPTRKRKSDAGSNTNKRPRSGTRRASTGRTPRRGSRSSRRQAEDLSHVPEEEEETYEYVANGDTEELNPALLEDEEEEEEEEKQGNDEDDENFVSPVLLEETSEDSPTEVHLSSKNIGANLLYCIIFYCLLDVPLCRLQFAANVSNTVPQMRQKYINESTNSSLEAEPCLQYADFDFPKEGDPGYSEFCKIRCDEVNEMMKARSKAAKDAKFCHPVANMLTRVYNAIIGGAKTPSGTCDQELEQVADTDPKANLQAAFLALVLMFIGFNSAPVDGDKSLSNHLGGFIGNIALGVILAASYAKLDFVNAVFFTAKATVPVLLIAYILFAHSTLSGEKPETTMMKVALVVAVRVGLLSVYNL